MTPSGSAPSEPEPSSDASLRHASGPSPRPSPRVWVLADDRPGNTTQSIGLADALGWPYEVKPLHCRWPSRLHNRLLGASRVGIDARRSAPLAPPWPDLVIAAGRRTAPVARWIRARAGGAAKIVQLGRKGGDDARLFDLVATPCYCRLLPHPHRIETQAPLHRITEAGLAAARDEWGARLGAAKAPRIAVLVGGTSGQYRLDAATARRIGEAVMRMALDCGGSVFATTSRRLGAAATNAFCGAVAGASYVHSWSPQERGNPYLGFLALADAFVITGDSESMLAEACSLGKPVYIYPLPVRRSFHLISAFREWVWRCATAGADGARSGLARGCVWLIQRGWVRPTRDLDRLHDALCARGVAMRFGAPFEADWSGPPLRDRVTVAARVRALMGAPSDGEPSL